MVPVAVGGFQENHVSLLERLVITEDGYTFGSQVTGKNHRLSLALVVEHKLDTGRSEHMSSLYPGGFDAISDLKRLFVGHTSHLSDDLLSLFDSIEWFHRRLTSSLQPAIFSLCIVHLDLCRISQD